MNLPGWRPSRGRQPALRSGYQIRSWWVRYPEARLGGGRLFWNVGAACPRGGGGYFRRGSRRNFFTSMAPGPGGFRFEKCNPLSLLPATKTILPPAVLAGLAANPLALLASRCGWILSAWFTAERLVGADSIPKFQLRLIWDDGPRRSGASRAYGLPSQPESCNCRSEGSVREVQQKGGSW